MKTVVLATHTPALFKAAVARVAELLRAGDLAALPTETVYGLAANALDPTAVARLFEVKGRPAHNPVIVHVASVAMAEDCVDAWPTVADKLAAAFWPGPLTLVLRRSAQIPDIVTAGGPTVGVRWSSHPFIQEVICACGFPLAVPSANPASQLSPTTAEHVRKSLGGRIPLIVDGGPSQVGIESTVLDLIHQPPQVLRPGMIHAESLRAVIEPEVQSAVGEAPLETGEPLRSPGQLLKHYSPKAKLIVLQWRDQADLNLQLATCNLPTSNTYIISHTNTPSGAAFGGVSVMPRKPDAFARGMYAEMHRCDEQGAELIVVEALPDGPAWQGIADRLRRAATSI
jgi:L-threonylcarbamoyladenylate synthase